jgi:hypothetical protein
VLRERGSVSAPDFTRALREQQGKLVHPEILEGLVLLNKWRIVE